MAAFATISVADGQASPVSHSFTTGVSKVLDQKSGTLLFTWLDFSVNGGVAIGANRIEMTVELPTYVKRSRQAGDTNQDLVVQTKIVVPTLETLSNNTASGINPQPTWAFDTTKWTKTVRNGRATLANVKDAEAFSKNFSALAVYTDVVFNYSSPV
jgi:hypothetical protein